MKNKNRKSAVFAIACGFLLAFVDMVSAQEVSQTLTLKPGWNAVYTGVSPDVEASDLFKSWPVHSVSIYAAAQYRVTERNASGLTGEYTPRGLFGIWTREAPASSTVRAIPADAVLVCFNTNSVAFTAIISGIPAAPRIYWHKSTDGNGMNYVGVRVSEPVSSYSYFAGSDIGPLEFYKIGGLSESEPVILPAVLGSASPILNDGDVLLMPGSKVSNWSGPLFVSPVNGVIFGSNDTISALSVRNDGVHSSRVTIDYASTGTMYKPTLFWRDVDGIVTNDNWISFSEKSSISKTLATGEVWSVQIAIDRTELTGTGDLIGGMLRITEDGPGKMMVNVPVSAVDKKNDGSVWPAGLWVASVTLNKVSRYVNDATREDGLPAGGEMKLRLLIHVDADGNSRLIQRVTIAGNRNSDGTYTQNLYAPSAVVPAGLDTSMRISCATLPVDLGVIVPDSGEFASSLGQTFTYKIDANSPSNPFRHPLHPQFDGLKSDFESPAPSGDDFNNYVGSVKPELFGVTGTIKLVWNSSDGAAWNPNETLTGTCRWGYTGLRREGTIWADGDFSMTRIVKDAILNK